MGASARHRHAAGMQDLPSTQLHERLDDKYQHLIAAAQRLSSATLAPASLAMVHACDDLSLQGAIEAMKLGLIAPFLVGPADPYPKRRESAGDRHLRTAVDRLGAQP